MLPFEFEDDRVPGLPGSLREWIRVLEVNPDGILLADDTGRFTFANEAASQILGVPLDSILGRPCDYPGWELRGARGQTFGPEMPFRRVLRTGAPEFEVELTVDRPNGTRTILSMNLGAIGDVETRGVIASFRDITGRKRVEEHQRLLVEAGRLLAGSLDYQRTLRTVAQLAVPEFADWCVVDIVEPGGTRRLGTAHRDPARLDELTQLAQRFPPHSFSGQPITNVVRTGGLVFIPEVTEEQLRKDGVAQDYVRVITQLGVRSVICAPLIARGEPLGALTFVRSERRYEEEDLPCAGELASHAGLAIDNSRLFEQAQESSRAKSTFISVMSHEFRTPLTTIVGYTELLTSELGGPLTDKQRDQLARIRASAWHLTGVIDEILTFSRAEAGRERVQRVAVDLADLTPRVTSLFEPAATAKDLTVHVELPPEPLVVNTDAQKVRQILFNLVSNAVKFTERGDVWVRLRRDDQRVVLEVQDTGVGIASEHREKIFESFWQVESGATRTASGTGLGLTITRRLAQLLGGNVELDSEPGVGSLFSVTLPLDANDLTAPQPEYRP